MKGRKPVKIFVYCEECGFRNIVATTSCCVSCGARLPKYCRYCGNEIPKDLYYCKTCNLLLYY